MYFQSFPNPNFVKTLKIQVKLILNFPWAHAITCTYHRFNPDNVNLVSTVASNLTDTTPTEQHVSALRLMPPAPHAWPCSAA